MPEDKKTRVQFDFTPATLKRLEELKEKTEAASYAEVIRNALKLYDGVVHEGGPDAKMIVNRPDGSTAIIKLFL